MKSVRVGRKEKRSEDLTMFPLDKALCYEKFCHELDRGCKLAALFVCNSTRVVRPDSFLFLRSASKN